MPILFIGVFKNAEINTNKYIEKNSVGYPKIETVPFLVRNINN